MKKPTIKNSAPSKCEHCGAAKIRENKEAVTYACGLSFWKQFGVTKRLSPLAQRFESGQYLP